MITKTQIKCIYALKNKIEGMDNDMLHSIVYKATGNEHISCLTDKQASIVIDKLTRLTNKVTKNGKISQGQKKKIYKMMYELDWTVSDSFGKKTLDMKRLNGFVRKYTKIDNYEWLGYHQASNVVEGLKKILNKGSNENE